MYRISLHNVAIYMLMRRHANSQCGHSYQTIKGNSKQTFREQIFRVTVEILNFFQMVITHLNPYVSHYSSYSFQYTPMLWQCTWSTPLVQSYPQAVEMLTIRRFDCSFARDSIKKENNHDHRQSLLVRSLQNIASPQNRGFGILYQVGHTVFVLLAVLFFCVVRSFRLNKGVYIFSLIRHYKKKSAEKICIRKRHCDKVANTKY